MKSRSYLTVCVIMTITGLVLSACQATGLTATPGSVTASDHDPVVIVGASYTAGSGPDNPALSWAAVLSRTLHWDARIYGVSGIGYVSSGQSGQGPVSRMLVAENLRALDPSLVIIQAGHDDEGVPQGTERAAVRQAIRLVQAQAPYARIALLTVFSALSRQADPGLARTDHVIVMAALAVDPFVIIMDPLAGHWQFQHIRGGRGLHPTAAGDAWIACKVAGILRTHGIGKVDSSHTVG
jgi:hypothetical protein